MPRFLSADASTLAAQYLIEALGKPAPNAPFSTKNDTHNKVLRSMAELFNIIPEDAEQK